MTIRDEILAFLEAHPGEQSTADIRAALESGDSVIDARAARILVDEVDRLDEEAKQAPVTELHDQQLIERFLERAGKYLTNDASREAAINDAVQAERSRIARWVFENSDGHTRVSLCNAIAEGAK